MRRSGWTDESHAEVLFDESLKCEEFVLGEGVDESPRRRCTLLQVDFEVVGAVGSKGVGLGFTENISKVMVIRRNL